MEIEAVKPNQLSAVWPYILRWIQEPLVHDEGSLTPEKIFDFIDRGVMILLVVFHDKKIIAAQTCEVMNMRHTRILNLVTTGGKQMDDGWLDLLLPAIKRIAIEQKCTAIRTRGRIGWLKKLKSFGYKPLYFITELEV